jgi:hypothetical protein
MSEFNIKAELYDEFKDFVIGLRDRSNPRLDLRDFDAAHSGPTHVKFTLENVDSAVTKLYTGIESFRPGTKMKTEEDLKDGTPVFVVYIPFKNTKKTSKYFSSGGTDFPNTTWLIVYGFLIMLTMMIALGFTKREDWRFLF